MRKINYNKSAIISNLSNYCNDFASKQMVDRLWKSDYRVVSDTYFVGNEDKLIEKEVIEKEVIEKVREAIIINYTHTKTVVYAIIVDKENPEVNTISSLKCYGSASFGGYAYDLSNDSYIVQCVESVLIGYVPFSFTITMADVGDWRKNIPIPRILIEKYLGESEKKILDHCYDCYPEPKYEINFVQMLVCN